MGKQRNSERNSKALGKGGNRTIKPYFSEIENWMAGFSVQLA